MESAAQHVTLKSPTGDVLGWDLETEGQMVHILSYSSNHPGSSFKSTCRPFVTFLEVRIRLSYFKPEI